MLLWLIDNVYIDRAGNFHTWGRATSVGGIPVDSDGAALARQQMQIIVAVYDGKYLLAVAPLQVEPQHQGGHYTRVGQRHARLRRPQVRDYRDGGCRHGTQRCAVTRLGAFHIVVLRAQISLLVGEREAQ